MSKCKRVRSSAAEKSKGNTIFFSLGITLGISSYPFLMFRDFTWRRIGNEEEKFLVSLNIIAEHPKCNSFAAYVMHYEQIFIQNGFMRKLLLNKHK